MSQLIELSINVGWLSTRRYPHLSEGCRYLREVFGGVDILRVWLEARVGAVRGRSIESPTVVVGGVFNMVVGEVL